MTDIAATGSISKSLAAAKALLAATQAFIDAVRPDLVTDGAFDDGADWQTDGFTIHDGGAYYATSVPTLRTLSQPVAITAGATYRLQVTVTTDTQLPATLYAELGGTRLDIAAAGDVSAELVAGSADAVLRFAAATVDGVSASVCFDNASVTPDIDAADRVHLSAYVPDDVDGFERPFAVISGQAADESRSIGTGAKQYGGTYKVMIERQVPEAWRADDQAANAELWFKNWLGAVIDEMWTLSQSPGYLLVRRIRIADGPWRGADEGDQNNMGATLELSWGLE